MKHEHLHAKVAALRSVFVAPGRYISPHPSQCLFMASNLGILTSSSSRTVDLLNATTSLVHGVGPFLPALTGQSTRAPIFPAIVKIAIDWADGPRKSCSIGYELLYCAMYGKVWHVLMVVAIGILSQFVELGLDQARSQIVPGADQAATQDGLQSSYNT